ncbi:MULTISPECIES: 23S rRNA (adenine(2058)-N(6))-methyltransferase Erm(53) [Pseudomonadati]|uniref:Erythromycin resistance methyltransferase N n=1 Tax=Campylobacter coli TaxID=195 RepID=A0A8E8V2P0_CAMCO|nr:23S rRNA (adenine(2058)-N(6))-methyltransferase Erm(53) [Campylobacter coli]HBD3470407.1 23S ribosomal RNA methyltransferase Erm [Escherichia coli]HEA3702679.1 23S ribosomal RNA methyltransferase Erm [Salmonella enterica subsp. enterica serovar Derby]EDO7284457.1 23S ribosomal RNA methyltransferase Erm [Campylobacter coli]QWF36745.1 erythromycin resistance methyltransferase N [Campylobacter coli]TNO85784.1 23S ribosomal RNA methyltransferase Erm [Campylobacter coli]
MRIEHSQNFLHSKRLVSELLSKSNITSEDTVIEIGPGKGIITEELSKKCGQVIGIEYDKELAHLLQESFANKSNVKIIEQDFLKYKLPNNGVYKICANIPFNLTADIMKKVLEFENPPTDIYFIMQYEAFLKYAGEPYYNESLRSLLYKPWYAAELLHEFQPSDFHPVPNARICFVHFQRKSKSDITEGIDYKNFLSYVFSASGNTFKEKTKKLFSYEQQKRICKQIKISMDSSVTAIAYEGWLNLYDVFLKFVSSDKKEIIRGSEKHLKNSQKNLHKIHRNRNNGYSKTKSYKKNSEKK